MKYIRSSHFTGITETRIEETRLKKTETKNNIKQEESSNQLDVLN